MSQISSCKFSIQVKQAVSVTPLCNVYLVSFHLYRFANLNFEWLYQAEIEILLKVLTGFC